jgi:adenine deaminase
VTFADLGNLRITRTFAGGRLVADNGEMVEKQASSAVPPPNNMLAPGLGDASFAILAAGKRAHIIQVIPEQIVTRDVIEEVAVQDGYVVTAPDRDILKIAVIERHKSTNSVGVGLVKGFGLREGALASSIAHDSHNVVVVGATDPEMLLAARTVVEMGGGVCAVKGGEVLGRLPLPVAGLMSNQSLEFARDAMATLLNAAKSLGCPLSNPYMAMAFLALPVIPELKITDKGLVDVVAFRLRSLFIST